MSRSTSWPATVDPRNLARLAELMVSARASSSPEARALVAHLEHMGVCEPEAEGRIKVPTAEGWTRVRARAFPGLSLAVYAIPGVRAWDLHANECDVHLFVLFDDDQLERIGNAIARAFYERLEVVIATRGGHEVEHVDALEQVRVYRFSRIHIEEPV